MTKWFAIALCLFIAPAAHAMDDTQQNRERQVDRYMRAVPVEALFDDMTDRMVRNLPAQEREPFKAAMKKHVNFAVLQRGIRETMIKIFTADEMAALAEFYSSPIGRSAVSKMGQYTGELMPLVAAEIARAQAAMQKTQAPAAERPAEGASATAPKQP